MPRPKKRFCPKGHDKDLLRGSYYTRKTLKNGRVRLDRSCAVCAREADIGNKRRKAFTRLIEGMMC